jgi:hypothetical protein
MLAKPPPGWNSWTGKPALAPPAPVERPRSDAQTAHACEWHEYRGSDDFDGCWA